MRIQIPYDPETPLLDIYLKKLKTFIFKDIYICVFISAIFTEAKTREKLKYHLIDDWIKKI